MSGEITTMMRLVCTAAALSLLGRAASAQNAPEIERGGRVFAAHDLAALVAYRQTRTTK